MTLALRTIRESAAAGLRPRRPMTIVEWADEYQQLPAKGSAEHGKYRSDRTPHMREIMECLSDDHPCEEVVSMLGSQLGKTAALLNTIGAAIHLAPCPILVVQPTDSFAEEFSKTRVAPMLAAVPELRALVSDPKSRDSGNTIQFKEFPGGVLKIVGANSPTDLASMAIRILLFDEVDRFTSSAGAEGSPIELALKRTTTFGNRRKVGYFSTPTVKGASAIFTAWESSDQRVRLCTCPHCGAEWEMQWEHLAWEPGEPESARYTCEANGCIIDEASKVALLPGARWQATAESGIPGFRLNALYLPLGWTSWADLVREYERALRSGDPEDMKTFYNTRLCRVFDVEEEYNLASDWADRGEEFAAPCPAGVAVLTAGVDVQGDRLEVEVVGWGLGEESWSVDFHIIQGDPSQGAVWADLDRYLQQPWQHETCAPLYIQAAGCDCGDGNNSESVYAFTSQRAHRRVWAVKGKGGPGVPIWPKRASKAGGKFPFYNVGVMAAKDRVIPRFKIDAPGAGYCHVPDDRDGKWWGMLAAEVKETYILGGRTRVAWVQKKRRNEAIDCRVYAYAALHSMGRTDEVIRWALDQLLPKEHTPAKLAVRSTPAATGGYMARFRGGGRG